MLGRYHDRVAENVVHEGSTTGTRIHEVVDDTDLIVSFWHGLDHGGDVQSAAHRVHLHLQQDIELILSEALQHRVAWPVDHIDVRIRSLS